MLNRNTKYLKRTKLAYIFITSQVAGYAEHIKWQGILQLSYSKLQKIMLSLSFSFYKINTLALSLRLVQARVTFIA